MIGPDRSVIEKIRKARIYVTFRPEAPEWFRRFMTDNYVQAMQQLNEIQNHFPLDPIAEIQGWPAADAVGVLTDDGAGHFSWGPGGASANIAVDETPSGTVDGVNATFTLAHTPVGGMFLYVSSIGKCWAGVQYNLVGNSITFTAGNIPATGDLISATYPY